MKEGFYLGGLWVLSISGAGLAHAAATPPLPPAWFQHVQGEVETDCT